MKDIYTCQPLWNPICNWFKLLEFYIKTTADSADGPDSSVKVHMDSKNEDSFDLACSCLI